MEGQDISSDMLMLSLLSIILGLNVRGDPICPPGSYGDDCAKNCSERCKVYSVMNRVFCDKTSGRCAEGCIPGWYDDKCNRECSKNCIKSVCNHQNGECTMGCTDGRKGTFCETQVTGDAHAGKTQENTAGKWAGLVTGIAASVAVAILILIGAFYLCRQKIRAKEQGDTDGQGQPLMRGLDQGQGIDTPLHKASVDGNLDTVTQLMNDDEIDVNARGLYGLTPLMLAALKGHHDVFEYLHNRGADMTLTDRDGDHILSMAFEGENMDIVKYAVTQNLNLINRTRNDGRTSLMWAAWHGRETIFVYLLDNGADYKLMDNDGDNILHYACHGGNTGIVEKVLAETEIDINSSDRYGRTAVMEAADQGHKQVFDILVRNGSSISHEDKDGNNVLHAACRGGHEEIVEHILSQGGFNINRRGKDGATPLMIAARGGHRGVFDLLVREGADASLLDNRKNNILHVACMEGHVGMVQHVLSRGYFHINCRGKGGATPLMIAAHGGHRGVFDLLVGEGADASLLDSQGNNILHLACME